MLLGGNSGSTATTSVGGCGSGTVFTEDDKGAPRTTGLSTMAGLDAGQPTSTT